MITMDKAVDIGKSGVAGAGFGLFVVSLIAAFMTPSILLINAVAAIGAIIGIVLGISKLR